MLKTLAAAAASAFFLAGAAQAQDMARTHGYLAAAGASDLYEVKAGQLAAQKGASAQVRDFGAMMVKDHTDSTTRLNAAAAADMGHAPPPPSTNADQNRMLADLNTASGADFDRMYVRQQLQAHQMALALHQGYAASGDQPRLRSTAGMIVPVVQSHLTMLQGMAPR